MTICIFPPRGLSFGLSKKIPKAEKKVAHTYVLYNIWSLCWKIQNAIFCVAPDKSWFDKVNFFGGKSGKSTWDFWKLCSVTPWLIILPKCIWWYIQIPTRIFFHEKSSVMLFQKNRFNHPIKTRVPYYLGWENFKKH